MSVIPPPKHFQPIVKHAHELGVDVPLLERMIQMIHEVEDGRRPFTANNLNELAATSGARTS